MKNFRDISEAKGDTAVFTFGRFNPPTTGHEKVMEALAAEQKKNAGSMMYVYASQSQNAKKDPLPYAKKIAYMKKMFPKYKNNIVVSRARNIFEIAVELHNKGHRAIVMVVGSDRVAEFDDRLNRYNGVDARHGYYGFDDIKIVSAGERDPDAEGVTGMSASKMRAAASAGDFDSFSQGLPTGFRDGQKLYLDVRKNMGIREERDMGDMTDFETLRDMYLTGKLWNVGDLVEANGHEGRVINKGTNYLSFVTSDGKVQKTWLHDIELNERDYKKEYENYHSKPEQIERRSSRNKARRAMGDKAVKGMDVGHKDNNPMNNDPNNLRNEDPSENRREPRLREMTTAQLVQKVMAKTTKKKGYDKAVEIMKSVIDRKKKERGEKDLRHDIGYYASAISKTIRGIESRELAAAFKDKYPNLAEELVEVKQDKDIKDREGTQPAKYYAKDTEGDAMAKSTKQARARHFDKKKTGPAPGDASATTKPSKHTKKFKQMYGEARLKTNEYYFLEVEDSLTMTDVRDFLDKFKKTFDISYTYTKPKRDISDNPGGYVFFDGDGADGVYQKMKREFGRNNKVDLMGPTSYRDITNMIDEYGQKEISEKLGKDADVGDYIDDFRKSDAPQFKGVSDKKLQKMAVAAYLDAKDKRKKEEVEVIDEKITALVNKAKKTGMPYGILKKVYDRGMAAYKTGHRPGATAQQWALARVNSFTTKSAGTWGKADKDLAAKVRASENFDKDQSSELDKINKAANAKATSATDAAAKGLETSLQAAKKKKRLKDLEVLGTGGVFGEEACCDDCAETNESLWKNIHKKRQRIKRGSGERMRKKGEKGAPTAAQMARAKSEDLNEWGEVTEKAEYQGRPVELNNPTRGDTKKYKVYVKNDKGNVIKVEFGDPNMSIKRDDPEARRNFRARHNCDQKKDKTTAGYWSCKFWSTKSVSDLMKG